jgi:hypothetical protein
MTLKNLVVRAIAEAWQVRVPFFTRCDKYYPKTCLDGHTSLYDKPSANKCSFRKAKKLY